MNIFIHENFPIYGSYMFMYAHGITFMCLHAQIVTTGTGSTMVHTSYNLNVIHVYHACVDHKTHMQFHYMYLNLCVCSSVPRTHGKTLVTCAHIQ